jgi:protease I
LSWNSREQKIDLFVDNLYEDLEVWYPLLRFQEQPAEVIVLAAEANTFYESEHGYSPARC